MSRALAAADRAARSLLRHLPAEAAHRAALRLIAANPLSMPPLGTPVTVGGVSLPNGVGAAAGLDKDGVAFEGLLRLGFGHVEVGSVSPRPQPGNARPRMERHPHAEGLLNRMGLPSAGAERVARRLARYRRSGGTGVVGVSAVACNDTTGNLSWDYAGVARRFGHLADFVTINASCPHHGGVRNLTQRPDELREVVLRVRDELPSHVPVWLKVPASMLESEAHGAAQVAREEPVAAVVACNAAPSHLSGWSLSGPGAARHSLGTAREMARLSGGGYDVVGCGGVEDQVSAQDYLARGARAVQLYSGLVFRGARLPGEVAVAVSEYETGVP